MLQAPLLKQTLRTIIGHIEHLPNGYAFWHGLPAKGRKSAPTVLRRWTVLLTATCFPLALRQAMLQACFTVDGTVDDRGIALYQWMQQHVYHGRVQQMYLEWSYLQHTKES